MFRQRPRTNQGGSEVGASLDAGLDLFFVSVLGVLGVLGMFGMLGVLGVLGVLSVKFEFAGVRKARF